LLLLLGNQLFPVELLSAWRGTPVFMAEDTGLCTYVRHHQQKLVLFLASMRAHAAVLREAGFTVDYRDLDHGGERPFEAKLLDAVHSSGADTLVHFEIEDRFFEARLEAFAHEHALGRRVLRSPMFLCPREVFSAFVDRAGARPRMADFYRSERRRLGVLVDERGRPVGGKWSFDADNRKRLPRDVVPPALDWPAPDAGTREVIDLVRSRFVGHPGDARAFRWPTTRGQALAWLDAFVRERLVGFGTYEDALSTRSSTLHHSLLSPLLNLGLLTPREVLDRVLMAADEQAAPLNDLEGFVRQLIGWREFVRGIDHHFGARQEAANFWNHRRRPGKAWYDATTGIPPLDDAIRVALDTGWAHHIQRLMVLGNLMTLCEIEPRSAWRWFMEMFVDSSDWVMGPNVYGMALFSDGGLFATKPYLCGANYLLQMSAYRRGDWCDVVDGLYWRFIARHRDFFAAQPRMAVMPRALDRLDPARRERIVALAENFISGVTCLPGRAS
jgi:deoxyribodipyrimidine photolyase-related protein